MADTPIIKDETTRKPRKPYGPRTKPNKPRKKNMRRIGTITLHADQALGPQLRQYREFRNYSRRELALLMGWSGDAGEANLNSFEHARNNFSCSPDKEIMSINTAVKYMRALGIKKFLFIISPTPQ